MLLVDMSHLMHRNLHMNKDEIIIKTEDGMKINEGYFIHLVYTSVLAMAKKLNFSAENRLMLALDGKDSWRKKYYIENSKNFPEYKNQTYKGNRAKSSEIPWDEIYRVFDLAMNNLAKNSDFLVLKVDGAEADDIIAIIAKTYTDEHHIVCSSDGDFHQLQCDHVDIYDPLKRIIIPKIDVERKKIMHFMLAGDDNIKQVKKGVGRKTVEKIIKEGLNNYLKINVDVRERFEFNRHLIDFDYIPKELVDEILTKFRNLHPGSYNPMNLTSFFVKFQLKKMMERINDFKYCLPRKTEIVSNTRSQNIRKMHESSIENFF